MKYLSVILLFLVTSCMATTDYDRLRQDVNGLQRENFQMRTDIDSLKEKTALVVREDSFSAIRESQSDINSRLNELSMGLQELRGRFEENRYFFDKTIKEYASERDALKADMARLENEIKILKSGGASAETQGKPAAVEQKPEAAAEQPAPTEKIEDKTAEIPGQQEASETPEAPDQATAAYESAYQTYKAKNYKDARKMFEAFIKDYPSTKLTDNAQFWIAETYYAEKDYEGAILAYESLLKKHPESDKIPGALLKQGFAFIEIGDKKTGGIILEKLLEKFPESSEAGIAEKKLNVLGKRPL